MTDTTTVKEITLPLKTDAEDWADKTFDRLYTIWLKGLEKAKEEDEKKRGWLWDDFWKAGNTLDCAINYLAVRKPDDRKERADNLIELSLTYLFDKLPYEDKDGKKSGHWRDDYGWWGNAFVNAYKNRGTLDLDPALASRCKQGAIDCWGWLYDSAKANKDYKSKFDRSMFGEGYAAWNNNSAKEYDESHDPESKYYQTPNTVTNAGFWALSNGLLEEIDNKDPNSTYLKSMRDTFEWFDKYRIAKPNLLINQDSLIFETANPNVHGAWCIDKTRAWTADQTVFLYSALKTLTKETDSQSDRYKKLLDASQNLISGLVIKPKKLIGTDGVLCEYPTDPSNGGNSSNFNDNYCTGPGVFMRYLAYALPLFPIFKDALFEYLSKDLISTSASKAWDNRRKDDNQIFCWYTSDFASTKYAKYYNDPNGPDQDLWHFAFQTAALDLFVALLRLY